MLQRGLQGAGWEQQVAKLQTQDFQVAELGHRLQSQFRDVHPAVVDCQGSQEGAGIQDAQEVPPKVIAVGETQVPELGQMPGIWGE